MNYLRDRSEQLADFLRERILNGDYEDPLPSTRAWCQKLGVGRPNLFRALQVLTSEGLISMTKRGAILAPVRSKSQVTTPANPKVVRILTLTNSGGHFDLEVIRLSEHLQLQGIRLAVETCSLTRLKSIAAQPSHPWELLCLLSIPLDYQNFFLPRKYSALVIGFANPEASLPYLTPDLNGSTRHAALSLLRRGFKHLVMLNVSSKAAGVAQSVQAFEQACRDWRDQPIQSEVQLIWYDFVSMQLAIRKLATKIKDPCGILLYAPISAGILVTALLQKGLAIPKQVEIMAIEHRTEEVQFNVPVTHYEVSVDRYAKEILHVALHYFETGKVPLVQKALPMKVTNRG